MERSASPAEAAAITAAVEQFIAETTPEAPAAETVEPVDAGGAARGSRGKANDSGPGRWDAMTVVKIIELVGSSKTSTDDAARQALAQAQGTLRNIRAVDIVSTGIRGENLDEYRAHVRVAFLIEGTDV